MPRILITRTPHQASPLADALRSRGLEPVLIPTIDLAPPTTFAPLDSALAALLRSCEDRVAQGFSLGSHSQEEGKEVGIPRLQPWVYPAFHWLLFTSANAVKAFATRLAALQGTGVISSGHISTDRVPQGFGDATDRVPQGFGDATDRVPQGFSLGSHSPQMGKGVLTPEGSLPTSCHIAAIGPSTAKAVHLLLGTKPTLIPPQAVAESLAEALLPHATQPDGSPTRFLLVRAEAARDILPETLRKAGGEVTIAPAYRTVIPQDSLPLIRRLFHSPETYPDAITFTSSSTVTNLLALLAAAGLSLPRNIPRISIGPITSQTLRDNNLPPHAESSEPAIESIVDKIIRCIG